MSNILNSPGNILCRRQHCTSFPDDEMHGVVNDDGTAAKDAPGYPPPVIIADLTSIPVPPAILPPVNSESILLAVNPTQPTIAHA